MKRRPRILLDAMAVRRQPAGVGRAAVDLIRALASRERGLDFLVATTEPAAFAWLRGRQDWTVIDCTSVGQSGPCKAFFVQFTLPRLCRRRGADLLHALQFVAPWRCPCPVVVTLYDLAWRVLPATVEAPRRRYYRLVVPAGWRASAAILAATQATAGDVRRYYPEVADKVTVVAAGTPSWVWQPAENPDAGAAAGRSSRPYFLFVGTREPRKNLTGLIAGYRRFLTEARDRGRSEQDIPDLVLAGAAGWLRSRTLPPDLMDLADRLHWPGYVDQGVLRRLYADAVALVFPSLLEGVGLPILEAMALGTPVLTSARGAMQEVAGGQAVLIDPEDPADLARGLHALAWDSVLRAELARSGPAQARRWDWAITADETCEVYRRHLVPAAK